MPNTTWKWDETYKCFFCGEKGDGCGVYKVEDAFVPEDAGHIGEWTGNVALGNTLEGIRHYKTPEEAQAAAFKHWQEKRDHSHN